MAQHASYPLPKRERERANAHLSHMLECSHCGRRVGITNEPNYKWTQLRLSGRTLGNGWPEHAESVPGGMHAA